MTTVRMVRDADGKTADVDPREVGNMHGWSLLSAPDSAGRDLNSETAVNDYKAVHRGRGSYSVMHGETELLERLTKSEAEEFNAMSIQDRKSFVETEAA